MEIRSGALGQLATLRQARNGRSSSYDRTGGNRDFVTVAAGGIHPIAEIKGTGRITHIWITIESPDPNYARTTLFRAYWDGEDTPSIEVPLGDFFGVGHGQIRHYVSLPLSIVAGPAPTKRAAFNSFFPMPFGSEARLEIVNESPQTMGRLYYYVDYELYQGSGDENQGRFHAYWNRQIPQGWDVLKQLGSVDALWTYPTPDPSAGYQILDAQGRGHYIGCLLNIDNIDPLPGYGWFGEGDDMIYIDGETHPPRLHGTGTEDYFGAAWCYPSGAYSGPYQGISLAGSLENWSGQWSTYRFHIEDPIHFQKSIRFLFEAGHANSQALDFSSVAYWYQLEPHKPFGAILPASARLPLSLEESQAAFWRHYMRKGEK